MAESQVQEAAGQTAGTVEAQPAPAPEPPKLSPLLEAIRKPIPGDNPCGHDVTYDDDYQKIKSAIDTLGGAGGAIDQSKVADDARQLKALGSLRTEKEKQLARGAEASKSFVASDGSASYAMIVDTAAAILTEKSKDLRVAGFLSIGLARTQGIGGLAEGIDAFAIVVHDFWEGLYPAKLRLAGRRAAIDFFTQYLTEASKGFEVTADDKAPLEHAKTAIEGLQSDLNAKIVENPPLLITLTRAVEDCLKKVPKPAPAPQAGAQAGAPGAAASAASAGAVDQDVKTLQAAIDLVRRSATFMRSQDRKNAAPYRLLRSVRWDAFVSEPPNDHGKTKIEAPPLPRRTYFNSLAESGQWDKLIDEGEASFLQSPFHLWLDLQRLTVSALDASGPDYQHAGMSIMQELAILLRRVPGLAKLAFSDGTGFASPATQDWIEESVMAILGGGGGTAVTSVFAGDDPELSEQFDAAKHIVDKGDVAGAVAAFQNGPLSDNSRRTRFRRRLYSAVLCIRGNQLQVARPILEELSAEIDRLSIDQWETRLVLEVWSNLQKCYESLAATNIGPGKQVYLENAARVFDRICKVDMGYALAATGAKPKIPAQAPAAGAALDKGKPVAEGSPATEAGPESEKMKAQSGTRKSINK